MCSPRSGGAVRMEPGVTDSLIGRPTWRMRPEGRVLDGHVIPSARDWGSAKAVRMSLIGPLGISASARARARSARTRGEPAASIGRSAARFATRSPFVAKRGSTARAGHPDRRAEPQPLALRADRDRDLPVGRRERLVRDDVRVGVAAPAGRRARHERVLGLVDEAGQGRFEDRHSTRWPAPAGGPLARSRARSAARTPTAPNSPVSDVGDRDADLGRATAVGVGEAGDRHEAGLGLEDEVVAGAVGPRARRSVAADPEMDEGRVERRERRVVEAEPVEAADPEVLDEHVGLRQEPAQDRRTLGLPEVEPDRALVAVDREVVGRGPRRRPRRRRPTAGPSRGSRRRPAARP